MRTSPILMAAVFPLVVSLVSAQASVARGAVYIDRDRDGVRDVADPGVPGVRVTNGREVVRTDGEGRYELSVDDDDIVMVIKPRGFMVETDADHVTRGYYVHKPNGSPKLRYVGVAPTGPLPASVDFALVPNDEPERFSMVVFGDPQPRDLKEVDWIGHDVLDGIDIHGAALGIALGDIAFDDLRTFEPLNATLGQLGVPMFYVHGNHDQNYDAADDDRADETWERVYGPTNYAFDWGPVHFVVLDDVLWHPEARDADGRVLQRGSYTGHFDDDALGFLRADLAEVPHDQLVVVAFHIHLESVDNRPEFFEALGDRPHTLTLSAHTHVHRMAFFGAEDGYRGPGEHLQLNHGTLCGSWFGGQPDYRGIPHATMADGTPNGWGILTFDGADFSHRYYGAGMPADEQMRITAPEVIGAGAATEVVVNVFAGSARSVVEMRVAGGAWARMEQAARTDPTFRANHDAEHALGDVAWRKLPEPAVCTHLWVGTLPADLPAGTHRIEVRTVDMFGQQFRGERTIRVDAARDE